MRFRIWTVLYVFALLAAALATFGGLGVLVTLVVLGLWTIAFWPDNRSKRIAYGFVAMLLLVCSCGLLYPAVSDARSAAQRTACRGQMAQIALLNYHDVYKSFPPGFVADEKGKPMHSWRVLLLPFMDEGQLYKAYDFDEPWNGPNNRRLASKMPYLYSCPSRRTRSEPNSFETQYLAIVGPQTVWPGTSSAKLSDITDKEEQTLLFIEVDGQGVHWMEPRDITMQQAIRLLGPNAPRSSLGHYHESVFHRHYDHRSAAFADGHTGQPSPRLDATSVKAMCTISAGDSPVGSKLDSWHYRESEIRWEGVYAFAVFCVLAMLPFPWWAIRERLASSK